MREDVREAVDLAERYAARLSRRSTPRPFTLQELVGRMSLAVPEGWETEVSRAMKQRFRERLTAKGPLHGESVAAFACFDGEQNLWLATAAMDEGQLLGVARIRRTNAGEDLAEAEAFERLARLARRTSRAAARQPANA